MSGKSKTLTFTINIVDYRKMKEYVAEGLATNMSDLVHMAIWEYRQRRECNECRKQNYQYTIGHEQYREQTLISAKGIERIDKVCEERFGPIELPTKK